MEKLDILDRKITDATAGLVVFANNYLEQPEMTSHDVLPVESRPATSGLDVMTGPLEDQASEKPADVAKGTLHIQEQSFVRSYFILPSIGPALRPPRLPIDDGPPLGMEASQAQQLQRQQAKQQLCQLLLMQRQQLQRLEELPDRLANAVRASLQVHPRPQNGTKGTDAAVAKRVSFELG